MVRDAWFCAYRNGKIWFFPVYMWLYAETTVTIWGMRSSHESAPSSYFWRVCQLRSFWYDFYVYVGAWQAVGVYRICQRCFWIYHTEFYYVELVAPQEIRWREMSRKIGWCIKHLRGILNCQTKDYWMMIPVRGLRVLMEKSCLKLYIKLDNSNLDPNVVAQMIKQRFHL